MDALFRRTLVLLVAGAAFPAYGDAPLGLPKPTTVCSNNRAFCATADPAENSTRVHAAEGHGTLWQVSGWHPYLYLSNDGVFLVALYAGLNLVPVDVSPHEPMRRFYAHGTLVRTVELGEWLPDPSRIQLTVSHRNWGHVEALTEGNQLIVQLSDRRRLSYDASSGVEDAP